MYFSLDLFKESYKLLSDQSDGKTNQERTSGLAYFLAIDMLQHELSQEIVAVPPRSEERKKFTEAVTNLLVIDKNNDGYEYQANHLGLITLDDVSISTKTGKNFLSTHVIRASKASGEADYPTRPAESELLVLGVNTPDGKFGVKKHPNWEENLMKYLNFRLCNENTFPLIVYLLRNKDMEFSNNPFNTVIEDYLREDFTDGVVNYLIKNAVIQPKEDWLTSEKWDFNELDRALFRIQENKKGEVVYETGTLYENNIDKEIPRNRIIYGAPGTGKSFALNEEVEKYFPDDNLYYRVTFHQNYTYSHFIGSYKPVPLYRETPLKIFSSDKKTMLEDNFEPIIDYQFVPGPFLEMFVKAYQNPKSSFVLVIEEINRANAAGVFGDVFQLLDRSDTGLSEYSIRFNADIMAFLRSEGIDLKQIRIPSNLFIWATMNSSDQGVLPIDTAFKRRWSFEYLPLNQNEKYVDSEEIKLSFLEKSVFWNTFRRVINDRLKEYVPEDKLIGPFFLKTYELKDPKAIVNKLLFYLREDVLRHNPEILFNKRTFSDIAEDYYSANNVFRIAEEVFYNEE